MRSVMQGGIVLALGVGLLTVVFALTGLHENPIVGGLLGLAVAIGLNIGVVIWVLRQTAAENGYGKQVFQGLLLGVGGGVLVFLVSWLLLTVVFPDYLPEQIQAQIDMLEGSGMPEAQVAKTIGKLEATTVFAQSLNGTIGTLFTSLIVGAIAAIFQRKR